MLQPVLNLIHERFVTILNLFESFNNSVRAVVYHIARERIKEFLPLFFQVEQQIPFLRLAGLPHLTTEIQNLLVREIRKVRHAQETDLPGLISAQAEWISPNR